MTLLSAVIIGAFIFIFSGCYTQIATTRDDDNVGYSSSGQQNDSTYAGNEDNGNTYDDEEDWHHHTNVGFSYYYPSYSTYWPSSYFSAAYSDPWAFGLTVGCYPWCYSSPFGYYGSYYPYYGGSYYPYYANYYPYYNHGNYSSSYGYRKQSVRTMGSTRGGAGVRQDASGREYTPSGGGGTVGGLGNLPNASVRGGASQPIKRSTDANVAPRGNGTSRVGAPSSRGGRRTDPPSRVTGSRGSMTRSSSPRDAHHVNPPPEYGSPSSGQAPRHDGGNHSTPPQSTGRGGGSPAPPSGGRSSSPPPPSRGGNSRGVRP